LPGGRGSRGFGSARQKARRGRSRGGWAIRTARGIRRCRSIGQIGSAALLCAAVAACSSNAARTYEPGTRKLSADSVVRNRPAIAAAGHRQHLAEPFRYAAAPKAAPAYDNVGMASWYGGYFHGRRTANGEVFDRMALTAAHPSLPMSSYVRVTNLANERSLVLRVNDRGPYAHGRLIDVSERAAELLGFRRGGTAPVRVEPVDPAAFQASGEAELLASYRGPEEALRNDAAIVVAAAEPPPLVAPRRLATTREAEPPAPIRLAASGSAAPDARIFMAFEALGERPL